MSINLHEINRCRAEVRKTAQLMLSGDLSYIEGAQIICHLLHECRLDPHVEPFVTFIGIDSETDQFPVGKQRSYWNKDALAKLDEEKAQYEERARGFAEKACRELLSTPGLDPLDFP